MKRETLLALATGFRETNPQLAHQGFVTIYKGEVTGWKRTLSNPGTEVPGAYAVGVDATIFVAWWTKDAQDARNHVEKFPRETFQASQTSKRRSRRVGQDRELGAKRIHVRPSSLQPPPLAVESYGLG